jgi:hypothetical protein
MRPSTIDLERALEMRESTNPETGQRYMLREIADYFGVSVQAVSKRFKEHKERRRVGGLPPWPWRFAPDHVNHGEPLYRLMQAYRRHEAGLECSAAEVKQANALRKWAARLDAAVTYDPERGFLWVKRRLEDSDEMFVVR